MRLRYRCLASNKLPLIINSFTDQRLTTHQLSKHPVLRDNKLTFWLARSLTLKFCMWAIMNQVIQNIIVITKLTKYLLLKFIDNVLFESLQITLQLYSDIFIHTGWLFNIVFIFGRESSLNQYKYKFN